jgi:hypothetical protein
MPSEFAAADAGGENPLKAGAEISRGRRCCGAAEARRQRPDFPFVGQFLLDLHELYRKPEEDAEPRCCECGDFIHYNFKDRGIARSDARYCRPACRQKAHRKRVTANRAGDRQRRNAATVRDGLPPAESDLTVTEGGAP